ncbi:glycosyl transferase family 4 [Candidatus Pacearchaeota archaeon]|nr:glycosyl transferase family 4 [Candidatus Pacearchaeota archaeon]
MEPILLITIVVSFFCTFFVIPFWIKKAEQIGLVWKDMNKSGGIDVAGSGGIIVLLGTVVGILLYVALKTFYFKTDVITTSIFAMLSVLFISLLVGLIDDFLGWRKGGLRKRHRIILILFSAIPLMVINAGESTMMGIEFGLLYPLFFIPLGIVGATTTYNFLAGYNGLEASQGIIILSALAFVTYVTGNTWLSLIALYMVASLFAFYIFNKYPAKIFPGDTLTYPVGSMIAMIAIIGNIEKIAVFFFIPYIIETGLKLRGGLNKESFAKVNNDGSLEKPYDKIYGLEHLAIDLLKKYKKDKKVHEKEVVYLINWFQIVVILLGLLILL